MRITLAIPPYSFSETYPQFMFRSSRLGKGYGAISGATAPLGTLYIASVLQKAGHKVSFVDGVFFPKEKLWLDEIKKTKPDFVGINSVSVLWEKTKKLSKKIKEEISGVKVGIAGSHVTGIGPDLLKEKGSAAIDFIFLGESENTIGKFSNALEEDALERLEKIHVSWKTEDIWEVATVCWRKNKKIIMIKKERPPRLDDLPLPARDLAPMEKYCPSIGFYKRKPHATIWTSRGCTFSCSFCTSKRNYRERSISLVLEEIKGLKEEYNTRDIFFYDNNIALNKERIKQLCKLLIKEDLDLIWSAQTRIGNIDKELLILMRKAGCWRLCYGIETPSTISLNKINKNIDTSVSKKILEKTKKVGIETFGAFILGIPGETKKEVKETIKFACSLPLDYAKFNIFTPFPDSRDYKKIMEHRKLISNKFTQHHVTITFAMEKKELENMFKEAYSQFYSRPSYILGRILQIRNLSDIERNMRGGIAFLSKRLPLFNKNK